uniref:Cullin-5 n=1 Tax=Strigamia maritima TaxID=126957 RepID=T1J697_STRMM
MPRTNQYDLDQHLDKLEQIHTTTVKILNQQSLLIQNWRDDLLHNVHMVCLCFNGPNKTWETLKEDILSEIALIKDRISIHSGSESQLTVKAYNREWINFLNVSKCLTKGFSAMQKQFLPTFMLENWKSTILNDNFRKSLTDLIRTGRDCDVQLVTNVRKSYINLSTDTKDELLVYRDYFLTDYIESTRAFYRIDLPEYLTINGVEKYMKHALLKLNEEKQRGMKYLNPDDESMKALLTICPEIFVKPFTERILEECAGMIERNDIENLQRMYQLMILVPDDLTEMCSRLEEFISRVGLADMHAAASTIVEDCAKYVQQLIDLFNRFSEFVKNAFSDDPRFLSSRDKAFQSIVNDTSIFKLELVVSKAESKCPELLAHFCDMLLRKTQLSKKLTSADIDTKLKDALLLLKYMDNKDVFMRYYKSHLTRRLIFDTSADREKEGEMVLWLKAVGMPGEYVMKVEQMFKDVKVSEDLNGDFKRTKDSINIRVLNAAAWARPSERVFVSVPVELEDFISEMEDFYRRKFSGRKLTWHHHMSSGSLTFVNSVGKFELDVTTFQMAVLFAWNLRPKERISFENLRLATELPDSELRKTIWSLVSIPACKQSLVLCHHCPEVTSLRSYADFTDETQFSINDEFGSIRNGSGKIRKRGKINLIGRLQLSSEKSRQVDNEAIVRLREFRVQEAIVCVVKARKSIATVQLHHELIEILKNMFLPTKRMLKEQVEWLIERDYLSRDKADFDLLMYVA